MPKQTEGIDVWGISGTDSIGDPYEGWRVSGPEVRKGVVPTLAEFTPQTSDLDMPPAPIDAAEPRFSVKRCRWHRCSSQSELWEADSDDLSSDHALRTSGPCLRPPINIEENFRGTCPTSMCTTWGGPLARCLQCRAWGVAPSKATNAWAPPERMCEFSPARLACQLPTGSLRGRPATQCR